ncbi:class I SAM-dependent methyltransferase [Oceanihabitans sediminis]|uniref:O-methyltransferase n=1 Tax=Oceanihabitans sediminis TaxID=1812012 RepID=UPI00299F2AB6|nr:class I SAM-dependent methyltransferase [Oceanihabitans sediminis]MDX1774415.1 class I SAM-dependent methyltransferase [Oceanihabitans sediminis]
MQHQAKQYIKFLKNSTNQHGVHSPFIYNLVTKCFYNKTRFTDYKTLSQYRETLYNNHTIIEVKDYGAGSRIFKSNKRKVSKIAKTAGVTKKRAKLLYRIANYLQTDSMLELGTSLGLATAALSLGNKKGTITTIEGCTETAAIAKQQFQDFKLKNIDIKVNDFTAEINNLKIKNFDLIYIDGNHQKDATLSYFNTLLNHIHNDSLMIFDDIHWSEEMTEAWQEIKDHTKVTASIDCFYWGIVFFRKEQVKEHFIIRL